MHLVEGQNCWRVAEASRVAFLVDGDAYFQAVADTFELARKVIYIVGWDVDSRIRLRRGQEDADETLGQFIDRLVRERPELAIYILEWDFAMCFSLERESWPLLNLGWKTHKRVHFTLDDNHPVGASHHQKIVVIDDQVAFIGGFDLTNSRWDTPDHAPDECGRSDNGKCYGPFHDVQMMVAGPVASELGSLARMRWERATGDELYSVKQGDSLPWPEHLAPDLTNIPVAILRAAPEHDGMPEVREIERFYVDAIAQAENSVYIENQYLTSHIIGTAIEKSLQKAKGPEFLIVLPCECSGWLEEETMGALRQRLLERLYRADRYRRLRVCSPHRTDLGTGVINVHSKVMVVDETLLTIGSANLSNRSMGFDTECNLALSADGQEVVGQAIADFRSRLLAEHLGVTAAQFAQGVAENGSLLGAVDALNHGDRVLQALQANRQVADAELSSRMIIDPERPIGMEGLLDYFRIGESEQVNALALKQKAWLFVAVIAGASLLSVLWRWSPLSEFLDIETLFSVADALRTNPLVIPIVLCVYLVGSCLMFPVTLLILATVVSFEPFTGFSLALSGSLLGGLVSYLLGHWLGRDVVGRLAGERVNRLSRKLARRGWLAIALVRLVPIAPFTIVNLVAGATHISTRSFLIGTAVGMTPGILAIMLFKVGLEQVIREPGWMSLGVAMVAVISGALVLLFVGRWLSRRNAQADD